MSINEKLDDLEGLIKSVAEAHDDCEPASCHGSGEPCVYHDGLGLVGAIRCILESQYATVCWGAEDLEGMTEDEAHKFLHENEQYIAEAMVSAGWEAIAALRD